MFSLQHRVNGSVAAPGVRTQQTRLVPTRAAGGFGKSDKKRVDTAELGKGGKSGRVNLNVEFGREEAPVAVVAAPAAVGKDAPSEAARALGVNLRKGWMDCGEIATLFEKKDSKVVELAAGKAIVLFRYKDRVYTTDGYSTAYQYPMFDAKVFDSTKTGRPAVEVPLDGTIYSLETGEVELWCPNDGNPVRTVLGALKKVANPVNIKVYRNVVSDGRVYVKYYEGAM